MTVGHRSFVVSQLGARMHYAVPRLLAERNMLERLYTDLCAAHGAARLLREMPQQHLPAVLRRLAGRVPQGIPPERITCFEAAGLFGTMRRMRARTATEHTAAEIWSGARLSRLVARDGFGAATDYYGFSGECLEAVTAAKRQGLRTTVEQIIAPRSVLDGLMRAEEADFGGWITPEADAMAGVFADRETAEREAADLVLCGSSFVRDAVIRSGVDPGKCAVVPYGVEARFEGRARIGRSGPLRVLTVGALGLRKGTPYAVAAAKAMRGRARFTMAGSAQGLTPVAMAAIRCAVDYRGQVPRSEIAALFDDADVFLLPSICEGSATVVYEALAAGLPVVCTPNAGSVVTDGEDGFIVPIRDADAVVDALERLAADGGRLERMSRAALRKAADYDLAGYGRRLFAALGLDPAQTAAPVEGGAAWRSTLPAEA